MSQFLLNQQLIKPALPAHTPILNVIRQHQALTGTKDSCREGDCGACAILLARLSNGRLHYQTVNACLLPLGAVSACHIVTIEGINTENLTPIQQALITQGAIQCGFCTSGLIMALTGFFLSSETSDQQAAVDAVAGNLCRCTGYTGIKRAIKQLCTEFDLSQSPMNQRVEDLVHWQLLPAYFLTVAKQLPAVETDDAGEVFVAGATDLWVQKPTRLYTQALFFLPIEAEPIQLENQLCTIQASCSIEQLRTSPILQNVFPKLAEDFKLIASAPIRHRATVGGNLVNASPIADLAIFFLVLNAELTTNLRTLKLKDFFLSYKKIDLQTNERLLAIGFNIAATQNVSYEKVSKRQHLDIASVNSALSIEQIDGVITKAHLSAGGVAPIPFYLHQTSVYLSGKAVSADTVLKAVAIADTEISPISDSRGSAQYKRLLFRQLLIAHFLKLFPNTLHWEDLYVR